MGAERSLSGCSEPARESQMKKRGRSLCLRAGNTVPLISFWKEVEIHRFHAHKGTYLRNRWYGGLQPQINQLHEKCTYPGLFNVNKSKTEFLWS